VERHHELRRLAILALQWLAVAVAYYGSAQLGLMIGLVRGQISPFWPPTGIAVFAVIVAGIRVWPGIFVGAVFVESTTTIPILVVPSAAGTTIGCVCAAFLLRRVGFRVELDRLKDALAIVFVAALGAMLVGSTLGSLLRVLAHVIPASYFWPTWFTWWTGDAMGVLVFTPLLLAFRQLRWPKHIKVHRWVEAVVLLVGSFVVLLVAAKTLGVLFLAFPFLGWAALRFRLAGAAPVTLIASVVGIDAAVHGYGPFVGDNLLTTMATLQFFNGSIALSGLLLATTMTERDRARAEIERTCVRLGEVAERLDQSKITPRVEPLPRTDAPDEDLFGTPLTPRDGDNGDDGADSDDGNDGDDGDWHVGTSMDSR
jgi:integral membrane sensor domain MASE1